MTTEPEKTDASERLSFTHAGKPEVHVLWAYFECRMVVMMTYSVALLLAGIAWEILLDSRVSCLMQQPGHPSRYLALYGLIHFPADLMTCLGGGLAASCLITFIVTQTGRRHRRKDAGEHNA